MSMRKIFFSLEGRIGRGTLWLTSIPLAAGHFLVMGMMKSAARSGGATAVTALIICILWLPVFNLGIAGDACKAVARPR